MAATEIVFVHGRSQGKKEPEEQKNIWIESLDKGLKSSGLNLSIDTKYAYPFYGARLDFLVEKTKFVPELENTLRYELLKEMAEKKGLIKDLKISKETEIVGEKSIFSDENFQKLLRLLERDLEISASFLKIFTKDVSVYLSREGVKKEINDIVMSSITEMTSVVVGHSLGSIVAYEVLSNMKKPKIPLFVTLGSPLGLSSVKRHVSKPFKKPASIKKWFNAYDERDFIALKSLENRLLDEDEIENYNGVKNKYSNHHSIEGYLSDEKVAREIYLSAFVDQDTI